MLIYYSPKIFDAAVMWKPDDAMDVTLTFGTSKEQEFDKTYGLYTKWYKLIVDIPEGDGLLVKSESNKRFAFNEQGEVLIGESFIIQQNGDKDVWMRCAMPYYEAPNSLKDDLGCSVDYYMPQGFLISYQMRRKHLYRWQEVNNLVKKQVEAAIFNQEN